MKHTYIYTLVASAMLYSNAATAQEKIETTVSADIVSHYVWRGQDVGNASLQPTLGIGWRGLSLSAWGSVGLAESCDTKELDLTLVYTLGGLNIGVTDYWFNAGPEPEGRYFKYGNHSTNHVFEANAGYDFGPVALQAYANFAGNDGTNDSGKRAYSTYVELSTPFRLGGADWTATVGAVPMATSHYATTGFSVTNVSVKAEKSIRLTDDFALPLFVGLTANPCAQKAYLVFGVTLFKKT